MVCVRVHGLNRNASTSNRRFGFIYLNRRFCCVANFCKSTIYHFVVHNLQTQQWIPTKSPIITVKKKIQNLVLGLSSILQGRWINRRRHSNLFIGLVMLDQQPKGSSKPKYHKPRIKPTNWGAAGSGMQAIFLDSGPRSCGTGVFLPRRADTGFHPTKKPGTSTYSCNYWWLNSFRISVTYQVRRKIKTVESKSYTSCTTYKLMDLEIKDR